MRLDARTDQATLERMYARLTMAEFLSNTPLHLGLFARYAALFTLFPSMVLGVRFGLWVMLVFCVGVLTAMVSGHEEWAYEAVKVWLLVGVAVFIGVTFSTLLAAAKRLRLSRSTRPAERSLLPSSSPTPCGVLSMPWRKERDGYVSQVVLCAAKAGVYALLIELHDCGRGRLVVEGLRGMCCPRCSGKAGNLQLMALMKLAAGEHRLRWRFVGDESRCPHGTVELVCRPM